uniref:Uncharacterized protein n=1 Tax=Populus trichocarpa TaxID=3694 RepID=A0A2K1XXW8_POPTR
MEMNRKKQWHTQISPELIFQLFFNLLLNNRFDRETYKIKRKTLTHLHHLFTTSYSKFASHKRKGKSKKVP